jgi:hypothetical protein
MGLMYLALGNCDKAEVYLQMAGAAGVPQALKAIKELLVNRRARVPQHA